LLQDEAQSRQFLSIWEKVAAPSFAAFGSGDTNVLVEVSIKRLESLDKEILIKTYPEGEHGITDPVTGKVQQAYLDELVEFIQNY